MGERDVQRARAAQVGLLMRSYRESFSTEGGRRGLTQEALLERMGSGDSDYAERYSHATVSRWESGGSWLASWGVTEEERLAGASAGPGRGGGGRSVVRHSHADDIVQLTGIEPVMGETTRRSRLI